MDKEFKINSLSLGLTYAGSFFGAGFVSGNEIYEFFGSFGIMGYIGLAFAILLFIVFGILLIRSVQLSGKNTLDEVIILKECKIPRFILGGITVFIMFGILVVMSAGAGALVNQVFSIPPYIGCLIFSVCVCVAAMRGLSGAVKVFSVLVPILVATTIVICVISINKYGLRFDIPVTNKNPMLGNWFFSAITYVSYNMITLIGTMIPVGAFVKKNINCLWWYNKRMYVCNGYCSRNHDGCYLNIRSSRGGASYA